MGMHGNISHIVFIQLAGNNKLILPQRLFLREPSFFYQKRLGSIRKKMFISCSTPHSKYPPPHIIIIIKDRIRVNSTFWFDM